MGSTVMSMVTKGVIPSTSEQGRQRFAQNAEDYYALIHWLRAGGMSAIAPRTVGIAGCARGVGVSTVARNLAEVAAESDERPVLLLDLSGQAYAHRARSKTPAAARPRLRETAATPTTTPNLFVLRTVDLDDDALWAEELSAIHGLLRTLESEFAYIVVDLPITDSGLCCQAAGLLNGVLLVIEAERTRFEAAARAKNRLVHAHAQVLGVVLNNHPQHLPKWLEARL
jgi:Mrp family chromosome partitioning ATPase